MYILIDETQQSLTGEVIVEDVIKAVHDGDSIKPGKIWMRLIGIDSPEVVSNHISKDQPQGREAAQFVRTLLKGKSVSVEILGKDKYKRPLGKSKLQGEDVGEIILKNGYAWYEYDYVRLSKEERELYKAAVKEAKSKDIGIWSEENPIRPRIWRGTYHN